ncbi:MAG: Lrp/AsnC family transcriptional regulator [Erythrobacter sp.]
MDKFDWKIVRELERDGRQSFTDLGQKVGLSKSPCWTRVRNLEEAGVLQGFGARLNPSALGLSVQSFVNVRIGLDMHAEFESSAVDHPAIIDCYTTAGDSDYLLSVMACSVEHLDDLLRHDLSKLPGVTRLSSIICLKSIKRGGSLSDWADISQEESRDDT